MLRLFVFALLFSLYSFRALALDIGLKISAESNWHTWGDYILGNDLKVGFEKLGHNVVTSYIEDFYPKESLETNIDVYMHGFVPFNPIKKTSKKNVMYLYYPLETAQTHKYKNLKDAKEPYWYSLQTELWDYDLIAVASPKYQKEIEKLGIKTIFTPQFTNPEKFFYEFDKTKAHDILFVGRPGYERISAKWAIESGFDVALYGNGWQDKAPIEFFKGDYIDNEELHKYYASSKIVLNDTRGDMKKAGFISNRVFDVTASGGFLISDYMEEIEQFYGDSIPMFKTKEELKELIDYYLAHPDERIKKAKKAQEITLKYFTNKVVAETIINKLSNKNELDKNKYALKFPYPKYAKEIGDYWLSLDLQEGFKENNVNARGYFLNLDNKFDKDDFYNEAKNLLYMQFKTNNFEKEDESKNKIMYLYFPTFIPWLGKFKNTDDKFKYNTDASLNNYLEDFDLIATPAKKTYEKLKNLGYKAEFVTQFTNPNKFKYSYDENLATDLLFVGSTWYERESVKYALELGYDVDVYGLNWRGKIDDKYIKGEYIDNYELYKYYSSAKIVLSDHAEDLEDIGLVINRLYDVSAIGVMVISEYSPYIEEIFGDSIPMFKNKEELGYLIDFYLNNPIKREKKAKKAQEITLKKHTNKVISNKFIELFTNLRKDK